MSRFQKGDIVRPKMDKSRDDGEWWASRSGQTRSEYLAPWESVEMSIVDPAPGSGFVEVSMSNGYERPDGMPLKTFFWTENELELISSYVDEKDKRIAELEAEVERLRIREQHAIEYERCITWDVTCSECANRLDAAYAETRRAEAAEDRLNAVKSVQVEWRESTASGHPECRDDEDCVGCAADDLDRALGDSDV